MGTSYDLPCLLHVRSSERLEAMMSPVKPAKFFRVQTAGRDGKIAAFVTRHSPAGGEVVTLKRDVYFAAKKAAASALRSRKQPA